MSSSFNIAPISRLFLRDARPMGGSDAGRGAVWPRPDHVWHAIFHAFHTAWPSHQEWEHKHHESARDKNKDSSYRFGALQTAGPFPCKGNALYFPTPLDWNMTLVSGEGTNLPAPLTHSFQSKTLGKRNPPQWVSSADYETYLAGKDSEFPQAPELYDEERDMGIAIQPETGTTEEGRLYQAEYIRLHPGVSLAVEASCAIIGERGQEVDLFDKLGVPFNVVLGGQQGISLVESAENPLSIPQPEITTPFLRWTLLTPAVFPKIGEHHGGWLPSWVNNEGAVCLPKESPHKNPEESRADWRKRIATTPKIKARLIAARVGTPFAFSGWDLQTVSPKPTLLAVPAGSCYVFECDNVAEAQALARLLNWPNRRSTLLGERGFGMGICSSYSINN